MSEARLYKKLKRATPGFDWERHEDKFTSGIPDCSYGAEGVGGWVELKTYDCWPRNPEDPLVFKDLGPEQRNWAIRRGRKHPLVFFLVGIGDEEWFLISWRYARNLGSMTKQELLDASHIYGNGPISPSISQCLIQNMSMNMNYSKKKWRVKYYYLTKGMDGKPDKWDRVVEADNKEDAIQKVMSDYDPDCWNFLKGCLSAVRTV